MSWLSALLLALVSWCAPALDASVHTYNVGSLAAPDEFFKPSMLHDASLSPLPTDGSPGPDDNRAYRTGFLSEPVGGSLFGDLQNNVLKDIGGKLTGNLGMLLNNLSYDGSEFELLLGRSISDSHTGALKFKTDGVGSGEFTGGFIDYQLRVLSSVIGQPALLVLDGTFFFKPQAETGSTALSPNRGDADAFTLWGYNYMHSSGPVGSDDDAVSWLDFLDSVYYDGGDDLVKRGNVGQTLGIALYASDPIPPVENSSNPEPTTFLVWGGLAMMALGISRRGR